MRFRKFGAISITALLLATLAPDALGDPIDCDSAPAETASASDPAFHVRDQANIRCAGQRLEDQLSNLAFHQRFWSKAPSTYQQGLQWQLANPRTLSITAPRVIPGLWNADPFRLADDWKAAGRGRIAPISLISSFNGSTMQGEIFSPPLSVAGPYPGVVFTTAGSQAYRHLYYWLAQGLAESGYMVMMYDVPAQGGSETFETGSDDIPRSGPRCFHGPFFDSDCSVLFETSVRDALGFFLSSSNPAAGSLNTSKIGLAGHSLGAVYSTMIGQLDPRVSAIVSMDSTGYLRDDVRAQAHSPTLTISADYPGTRGPQPALSPPYPWASQPGFRQLTCQAMPGQSGAQCQPDWKPIDGMQVALRGSTHYEWAYLPYATAPRTASRYGERVSFYYTLAWFDSYLKGSDDGFRRLTARIFDQGADASSIGAGTGATGPGGAPINVPYSLAGKPVGLRHSFYYRSSYLLKIGSGAELRCDDMRLDRKAEGGEIPTCDRAA